MAYIGNTNTTQGFIPAVDYFNGDGATVAFTLSRPVASVAQVQAVIENVPQNPGSAYTVSGNTITFTSAPPNGTSNIYVYYTSPITQVIQPGQGTVGTRQLAPLTTLPVSGGATLTLPTTSGTLALLSQIPVSATYLVVAGGGSGAASTYGSGVGAGSGGGGAGGLLTGTATLLAGTTYSFVVGAGGAAVSSGTGAYLNGNSGSNSTALGLTAIGGGYGGAYIVSTPGGSGGSGGGAANNNAGGSGTSGQGNAGGAGSNSSPYWGGSGGGAGAAGVTGTAGGNGVGGVGLANTITGSSVFYAGGGGATDITGTVRAGGNGGGGQGGGGGTATAGTANTGGGGGGSGYGTAGSGAGGSGVVIISVPTDRYSGTTTGSPTITTSGSNTIIKFTSSGSYTA